MNGPEAAKSVIRCPQERLSSHQWHYLRLQMIVRLVCSRLVDLARLGRPGQWILHHEDLYNPRLDTRPQSRKPDKDIPLHDVMHLSKTFFWAGDGPVPDFKDIAFWRGKRKDLDNKIELVKAGRVQPRFKHEELQTLESLERQDDHFYSVVLNEKRQKTVGYKIRLFNVLFSLAKLGRAGQWILHNEELYHPAIDTRPQTRETEKKIIIRDSTYRGNTRVLGDGLLVDYELTWAGQEPQPDFAAFDYWESKLEDLCEKTRQVEEGRVQPLFTAEELQTLESLEADEDHAFAKYMKEQKETPPVVKTAESRAAERKLSEARQMVVTVLDDLWDCGLAGKWVLHCEDLYLPAYDTRFRERDEDEDEDEDGGGRPRQIVVDSFNDLRYDSRFKAPPDFSNITYWEEKRAELRKKRDYIRAGRQRKHNFSKGELMRIKLLEHSIQETFDRGPTTAGDPDQTTKGVEAWLDSNAKYIIPPPPPPVTTSLYLVKRRARKRKRPTDNSHADPVPRHALRPAKRSKAKQPQPKAMLAMPTPYDTAQHRPSASSPHELRGHVRIVAPASPPDSPNSRSSVEHSAADVARRGGNGAAKWQTQRPERTAQPSASRGPGERGGSLATSPPLRKSARIAALAPKATRVRSY
ncbi:hypothetical protein SPI_00471 [Niveomyces insectorum RCEF 264]|uniref:Uncharacterized protein n=1 Tax=Niveomyces insectorum RCEF 264 TaxID=1081102 RepID=A0A168A5J9_9HYPO|nr:hypothetical protein SPI_00471 [Niveomyces insectorum RCEF 264]